MDDIVLFQILPRLPAKSLGRFMCVCKQWHSFLTSPAFTKMHLHHVSTQNHHKLIVVSSTKPCNYFCKIDCETPELGLSANRPLPFEVGRMGEMSIISSLNGLVCVGIKPSWWCKRYKYLDIILWNPLTGEYKMLSKDNNNNCLPTRGYGLYYSSCDDDYKLLRVTQSSDAYIYSWKNDSWRNAKSRVDSILKKWLPSCLVNEKLYFLARGTQGSCSIIMFDTKTEMFTEIATPPHECFYMSVIGGCIHLCVIPKIDSCRLELWKMDGDGKWTKVICSCRSLLYSQPCHLMKNGNWLMHAGHKLYVYKVHRKQAILETASRRTIDNTMEVLSSGKFVETIVSLK